MVAMSEIDSFFIKFKQLVYSGKNAHLDVKSEAGKAIVHLTVEVDVQHQHRAQPRNGPARQRRRERRAAAREAAEIANHFAQTSLTKTSMNTAAAVVEHLLYHIENKQNLIASQCIPMT